MELRLAVIPKEFVLLAAVLFGQAHSASAAGRSSVSRFDYCAPPTAPACVDAVASNSAGLKQCEADVERYTATVFAYRACLAGATERAVREANDTIRKIRCARDPGLCAASNDDASNAVGTGPGSTKSRTGGARASGR
jgi:hypothetical protein